MNQPTDLPRLLRPQPASFFPQHDIMALWDSRTNTVHYREDIYHTLTPDQRKSVVFLREKYLYLSTTESTAEVTASNLWK